METFLLDGWKQDLILLISDLGLFARAKLCLLLALPQHFVSLLILREMCLLQINKAGMMDYFSAFQIHHFKIGK